MRYSRSGNQPVHNNENGQSKSGVFFIVILLIAAVVYILLATKAGEYLSEKILTPVVEFFAGKTKESEPAAPSLSEKTEIAEDTVNKEITFPALDEYLLQSGIFGSEENAVSAANELKSIGGAGFIREEDGKYRVIISGYSSKDDAVNVKDRLKNERGMETKLIEMIAEEMTCTISCSQENAEMIQQIADEIPQFHSVFLNTAMKLDKGNISAETASQIFLDKKSAANSSYETLNDLSEQTNDPLISALHEYYGEIKACFEHEIGDSAVSISSGLKFGYVGTVYAYSTLLNYDTDD